jgi:SAM-dependent methyltransferase
MFRSTLAAVTTRTLNLAARAVCAQGRLLGGIYERAWPILGIPFFDHRFDYLRGPRHWFWCERGVLGNQIIRPGHFVLDVCCGDGFYSGVFYGSRAAAVDGLDSDPAAIRFARKHYERGNVRFYLLDAVSDPFPREDYDVVILFSAISTLDPDAGVRLLRKIALCTRKRSGVLLGSTPILESRDQSDFSRLPNQFVSTSQLECFLKVHFRNIDLWCSQWPRGRVEAYFRCSDGIAVSDDELQVAVASYRDAITAPKPGSP